MTRYEYDVEASEAWHMDVVHEVPDDGPVPVARWVDATRRLNANNDPLARKLIDLHRDCGTGTGLRDAGADDHDPGSHRRSWGCETTAMIAEHFGTDYSRDS